MDTSTWINFLLLLVSLIAAFIAWDAKMKEQAANRRNHRLTEENNRLTQEANELQAELLAIEREREKDRLNPLRPAEFQITCKEYAAGVEELTATNIGERTAREVYFVFNRIAVSGHGAQIPPGHRVTLKDLPPTVHQWKALISILNGKMSRAIQKAIRTF